MLVRKSSHCLGRCSRLVARLSLELLEDRSLLSGTPLEPTPLLIVTKAGDVQSVPVQSNASAEETLAAYKNNPNVAVAELDYPVSVSIVPNDASFGSLWGMNNTGQSSGKVDADIDAPEAWDKVTGKMTTVVGIIDTGIDYRHPDLYLNVWLNQGEIPAGFVDVDYGYGLDGMITFRDLNAAPNRALLTDYNSNGYIDAGDLLDNQSGWENGQDNDGNGYTDDLIGWDWVNNDNDPLDDNNHGSHVAGTIGAIANNGIGVAGVNWFVSMAGLKFLNASGSGSTSNALKAQQYATAKGFDVTNNSWGGGGYSQSMFDAITAFRNAGGIFVAAAGNSSVNTDTTANYPSNYAVDNVLSVAATDRNDVIASFSNYGASTVDLAAPGVSIYSTVRNGSYATFNGTSMATPHVAGAAALIISQNPTLSYSQVITRILNNVDPVPGLAGKVATGGRLNLNAALDSAPPPVDSTGPYVVSASLLGTASAVIGIRVTFSEAVNASSFSTADITNLLGSPTFGVSGIVTVSSTVFDVVFNSTQSTPGAYSFDIGPNVTDLAGNAMDQDRDNVLGEPTDFYHVTFTVDSAPITKTYTNDTDFAIKDATRTGGTWSKSTITITDNLSISDLNVKIDLAHTYDADLEIWVQGPDGTEVLLSSYRGGSANNYTNTVFDDEASTPISAGSAPFTGTFRGEQLLSAFDGKSTQGTWTLWVYDGYRGDKGTILSWSLIVTRDAGGQAAGLGMNESTPTSTGAGTKNTVDAIFESSRSATSSTFSTTSTTTSTSLFSLGESNDENILAVITQTTFSRNEVLTLTSVDDLLRQRQEALDELFSDLTEGVGGGDEVAPVTVEVA